MLYEVITEIGRGGEVGVGFSSIFWNTAWTGGQKPHTLGILCDPTNPALSLFPTRITSYNVCYTKLLRYLTFNHSFNDIVKMDLVVGFGEYIYDGYSFTNQFFDINDLFGTDKIDGATTNGFSNRYRNNFV